MNHIYRLVWNETLRAFVAVAEFARARGKRTALRRSALAGAVVLAHWHAPALANPQGGTVAAGSATITELGTELTVTQSTDKAIINWQGFSIGADEHTRFIQPNSSSVTLNRVIGNDVSEILGRLTANGHIYLVNPNGIVFGKDSRIDVQGLIASTLDIADEDFLAGRLRFIGDPNSTAGILNEGLITAKEGGLVALVAPWVHNSGLIEARLGRVALASANGVTIDLYGDELLTFGVDDQILNHLTDAHGNPLSALVANSGTIAADGGRVLLTTHAAKEVVDRAISMSGVIQANTVSEENGVITLSANAGEVNVSGTLEASGQTNGDGGEIWVLSEESVTIESSAELRAEGGTEGGDGGFIETSAAQVAINQGVRVSAAAPNGKAGEWLIDPNDITIQADGSDTNISGNPDFVSTNDSSIITTGTIETALNAGTNVTITTDTAGTNSQAGDIHVNDSITSTSATDVSLTLNAHNDININADITATEGQLNMVFNANTANGGGVINLGAATLDANGGAIDAAGQTVNKASGTTTINNVQMTLGALNFTGGTLQGTGSLTTTGFSTISAAVTLDGLTWNQTDVLDITGSGGLTLNNGATLNNAITGVINLVGTNTTPIFRSVGAATLNNHGTLNKLAGTTTSQTIHSGVDFHNSGSVNIDSGTLNIAGNGTDTGAYTVASGATLSFNAPSFSGVTRTLDTTSSVTGTGTLQVNGTTVHANGSLGIANTGTGLIVSLGTLNANADSITGALVPLTVSGGTFNLNSDATLTSLALSIGTLTLNTGNTHVLTGLTLSSGTLAGSDAVEYAGDFTWSNSTFRSTGGLTTTGLVTISGNAKLSGATWEQYGTVNISGSLGRLSLGSAAVLNNHDSGVINLSGSHATPIDRLLSTGTNIFNNSGTLNKLAGSASAQNIGSSTSFFIHNSGAINVQEGVLRISGSGTDTGVYDISSGATLTLLSGTRTLDTVSRITGAGRLWIGGATVHANGSLEIANTGSSMVVASGRLNANTEAFSGEDVVPISVTGGILDLKTGNEIRLSSLTFSGGTITGSDAVVVEGDWSWSGVGSASTFSSTGGLVTTGTTTIGSDTYVRILSAASWAQNGTLIISGTGSLRLNNGAVLNNDGTINISDTGAINRASATGISTINNMGIINIDGAPTYSDMFGWTYNDIRPTYISNNAGARINVAGGVADVYNIQKNEGVIDVSSGAKLIVYLGGWENDGTISGSGTIHTTLSGGLVNKGVIAPGASLGTLTIESNLTLATGSALNIELGGTAEGEYDRLHVTGDVTLGGTLNASLNGGYTPADADFMPFVTMDGTRSGTFASLNRPSGFSVGYDLAGGEAARIIYAAGDANTFTNADGGLNWNVPGNWSDGALPSTSDDVLISAGYAVEYGSGTSTIGSLTINDGNSLNVSGGELTVAGATNAAGQLLTSGGTLNLDGSATIADVTVSSGAFNLNNTATITTAAFSGGTLGGTGNVTVTGALNVTGTTTFAGNGLTTQGTSTVTAPLNVTSGLHWVNEGTLAVTGGHLSIHDSAFTNAAGATLTLTNASHIAIDGNSTLTNAAGATLNLSSSHNTPIVTVDGTVTVNNAGTLNQTETGIHSLSGGFVFTNTGTINANAGTLDVAAGFTANSGTIHLAPGATFQKTGGFTNEGTLSGSGTVAVGAGNTLTNNGTVRPGASPGTLTIDGDFTQTTDGVLEIELDSPTAGQFDVLNVSGTATLDGTINFTGTGGEGDYVFLTADTVVGTFGNRTGTLNPAVTYNAIDLSASLSTPPTTPGTTAPGTTDPGTTDPGTTDPGTTDPGTDEPVTEDPVTEDPITDEPGTDEPAPGEGATDTTSGDILPPEDGMSSGGEPILMTDASVAESLLVVDELVTEADGSPGTAPEEGSAGTTESATPTFTRERFAEADEIFASGGTIDDLITYMNEGGNYSTEEQYLYFRTRDSGETLTLLRAAGSEASLITAEAVERLLGGEEVVNFEVKSALTAALGDKPRALTYLLVLQKARKESREQLYSAALEVLRRDPNAADAFNTVGDGTLSDLLVAESVSTENGIAVIEGRIEGDPAATTLTVDGRWVYVGDDGSFRTEVAVPPGESLIAIAAADEAGTLLTQEVVVENTGPTGKLDKTGEGRRVAILIGAGDYQHERIPDLDNPHNDVKAMAELFSSSYGFEPQVMIDAGKAEIVEAVKKLAGELTDRDQVVLYYAGHGYSFEDTDLGYWLPADAGIDSPENWISTSDLTRFLRRLPSRQVGVVSDSCYSGAFTGQGRLSADAVLKNLDDLKVRRSVTVLSSGGDEPVWDGGADGHSIFAASLLSELRGAGEGARGIDIYGGVRGRVKAEAPQTPHYGMLDTAGYDRGGDFVYQVVRDGE